MRSVLGSIFPWRPGSPMTPVQMLGRFIRLDGLYVSKTLLMQPAQFQNVLKTK